MPPTPAYYETPPEALRHLAAADPQLGRTIDALGPLRRQMTPDLFEALTESIVAQQISGKAAATILRRIRERCGRISPEALLAAGEDRLGECGLSRRKAGYITAAANAVLSGAIPVTRLYEMTDEEVVRILDALPGIGRWTAEMILIFSFGRHDVLSFNDLGIRRGLMKLHSLDTVTPAVFARYRVLYSPFGTAASLYLWEIASGGLPQTAMPEGIL